MGDGRSADVRGRIRPASHLSRIFDLTGAVVVQTREYLGHRIRWRGRFGAGEKVLDTFAWSTNARSGRALPLW